MTVDVYLPFLVAAIFGTLGVHVSRRLPPARATWLLSAGACITSACCMYSLSLLAWAMLGRFSVVASIGDWSTALFRRHDPVSVAVSIVAIGALVIASAQASYALLHRLRTLRCAYRACRQLPPGVGELVVVADGPEACAVPGRPGRIVVSQRFLTSLSPTERTALLAHERSHLRHRHHLHQLVVGVAASTNPLLRAAPRATSDAVERWADADAVRLLCAPEAVASALRHASAANSRSSTGATRRITSLQRTAQQARSKQRGGWSALLVSAAVLVGLLVMAVEETSDAAQLAHRCDVSTRSALEHHVRQQR
jgi:Peptidase family M48